MNSKFPELIHQFLCFLFCFGELQAVCQFWLHQCPTGLEDDANGPVPGPATKPFSNQGVRNPRGAWPPWQRTMERPDARRLEVGTSAAAPCGALLPAGIPIPYRSSYHPKAGASDFSETIPSHPISSQEPHPRNQHTRARAPDGPTGKQAENFGRGQFPFLFPNHHPRFRHCIPSSPSQSPAAPAPAAFPIPPPTTTPTATMHAAGVAIIVILLLVLAAATGWIVFTRMRAQRLGVRPLPSPTPTQLTPPPSSPRPLSPPTSPSSPRPRPPTARPPPPPAASSGGSTTACAPSRTGTTGRPRAHTRGRIRPTRAVSIPMMRGIRGLVGIRMAVRVEAGGRIRAGRGII